jgi:hypothetical protein
MKAEFKKGDKVWWQPASSRIRKTGTVVQLADPIVGVWYKERGGGIAMVHISELNHVDDLG